MTRNGLVVTRARNCSLVNRDKGLRPRRAITPRGPPCAYGVHRDGSDTRAFGGTMVAAVDALAGRGREREDGLILPARLAAPVGDAEAPGREGCPLLDGVRVAMSSSFLVSLTYVVLLSG